MFTFLYAGPSSQKNQRRLAITNNSQQPASNAGQKNRQQIDKQKKGVKQTRMSRILEGQKELLLFCKEQKKRTDALERNRFFGDNGTSISMHLILPALI